MSQFVWSAQELVFRQQTKVYASRNPKADVLTVYERGDRVPVSKENYGPWKKIIAEANGKKQIGWVMLRDLKGARIRKVDEEKVTTPSGVRKKLQPVYRKNTGVGFAGNLSYYKQGSGEEDLQNGSRMNYSGLDGTAVYLSVFGDFELTSTLNLRGYIALRDVGRSGNATYPPGTDSRSTNLDQTGFALGSTLKFYSNSDSNKWWGPGIEIMQVSKSDVTATSVTTGYKDDPLYVFAHLAAGYDFHLFNSIFILPEVRLGAAVNGSPFILNFEILIPFAYRF